MSTSKNNTFFQKNTSYQFTTNFSINPWLFVANTTA